MSLSGDNRLILTCLCGTRFLVPAQHLGQTGTCKVCGNPLTVSAVNTAPLPTAPPPAPPTVPAGTTSAPLPGEAGSTVPTAPPPPSTSYPTPSRLPAPSAKRSPVGMYLALGVVVVIGVGAVLLIPRLTQYGPSTDSTASNSVTPTTPAPKQDTTALPPTLPPVSFLDLSGPAGIPLLQPITTEFDTIQQNNQLTIEVWVRFDSDPYSSPTSRCYVVDKDGSWRLWFCPQGEGLAAAGQFFFDIWDWQGVSTKDMQWMPNQVYYLVAEYDGVEARIYVDGVWNNTATIGKSLHPSTSSFAIGSNSSRGDTFPGTVLAARVWNYPLAADTIMFLQQGGEPPSTDGLIAKWMVTETTPTPTAPVTPAAPASQPLDQMPPGTLGN